jgi:2-dehydro-3-deoxygluconokinase
MQLVTFGEAMLRITPRSAGFDVYIGGAELNVAVTAAKLGVPARWVSRLPENAPGRAIAERAREHGVDVSGITWTKEGRVGIYYVEVGTDPSATRVTYDRAGSTMACVGPGMIDWASALGGATWLHVSGITPALSESAAATTHEALSAARDMKLTISYDLNYRPQLWSPVEARAKQTPFLGMVDVLIASEDAARLVFEMPNVAGDTAARGLRERYAIPTVVITVRDSKRSRFARWSAIAVSDEGVHCAEAVDCEVIDPIGAGDAFTGGVIAARLQKESWDVALRNGVALAALKHATSGDFSQASRVPR